MRSPVAERRTAPSGAHAPVRRSARRSPGTRRATPWWLVGASLALVVSVVVAVTIGPADLSWGDVWRSIATHLGLGGPLDPVARGARHHGDVVLWAAAPKEAPERVCCHGWRPLAVGVPCGGL